ncbi:molybdopterin-dependent oxidoreductase [Kineococcus gypseus]|uniref:molybdopterin-dependent oxidoreductase n=1 Tax=Kineococcus gypseus TaxID=1637102 RepID=UPI003D7C8065
MRTPGSAATVTAQEGSAGRRSRAAALAALSGVLAAGLTVGVGQLVAGLPVGGLSPAAAPVVVVGDAVVDLVPAPVKDFAIRTFGTADKAVLLGTIAALVLLLAAAAGVLARRRLAAGVGLVAVLGVVGALAAATRPDASALWPLPSALGAAAGAYALTVLTRRLRAPSRGEGPRRRAVLLGGVAAAGLATGGAGRALTGARSAEESRARVTLPAPADPAPPLPAGTDPAALAGAGLTPYATGTRDFYRIDTALVVPDVRAEDWSLRLHGMVEQEITLTYADLLALPLRERWITLTCVSNEVGGDYVGNARWLGYPLADLLGRAGVRAGADMLFATSTDGFTLSAPLAEATDGRDAMLVVGMDGEPLPREHGFPVRMVIPGLYGFVSACKWVTDIEVTRFAERSAYWTQRGWAEEAPIKTASRIDVPGPFGRVRAGRVPVAGVAWAQTRGVRTVEVRVDRGEWEPARLLPSASADTWCQWVFDWDAEPGGHVLEVRATDGTGTPQTGDVVAPIPNGSSGFHSVTVTVE